MDKAKQWLYYILIGVISLIALVFLPMMGSAAGLGWVLPTTAVGWIIWIVTKLIIATLNVLIFHCFMCQAVLNSSTHPNYIEARGLLMQYNDKEYIPRDPRTWKHKEYRKKGISIFISSALSVFALTQAVLSFDVISMLTYLFTIVMGLIFGILQMKSAEEYWTQEYLEYARWYAREREKECAQNMEVCENFNNLTYCGEEASSEHTQASPTA